MNDNNDVIGKKLPFRGDIIGSDGIKRSKNFKVRVVSVDPERLKGRVEAPSIKLDPDPVKEPLSRSQSPTEEPLPEENKSSYVGNNDIISPPYDPLDLIMLEEVSNVLRECIDSMVVNIGGFGYYFRPRKMEKGFIEENEEEIKKEELMLTTVFRYISQDVTFTETRKKWRKDLELTGNAFLEVIRDKNWMISQLNHIPSHRIRLLKSDNKFTKYPVKIIRPDKEFTQESIERRKRFRRFVQLDSKNQPGVYFKEYGDPRALNKNTGEPSRGTINSSSIANELVHFKIYSPRSVYGIPRFVGRYVSILGSRKSEEINYFTLDNNVPSMFVMVENGSLTEGSIGRLNDLIESQVSGQQNFSKFVILEAEADMNEILPGQVGAAKVTVKSMTETQRTDQMFQDYDMNNQNKVRQAFRLPPIFVGRADDYTRATAFESRKLADEQVFAPERSAEDMIMTKLLEEMGVRFHEFKSRTPNVTDNESLIQGMRYAELSGGMTPARADKLMEDIFEGDLGPLPEVINPNVPYSLQYAAAQNGMVSPDGASTNEPEPEEDETKRSSWVRGFIKDALGPNLNYDQS